MTLEWHKQALKNFLTFLNHPWRGLHTSHIPYKQVKTFFPDPTAPTVILISLSHLSCPPLSWSPLPPSSLVFCLSPKMKLKILSPLLYRGVQLGPSPNLQPAFLTHHHSKHKMTQQPPSCLSLEGHSGDRTFYLSLCFVASADQNISMFLPDPNSALLRTNSASTALRKENGKPILT